MLEIANVDANHDKEARSSILNAICILSKRINDNFDIITYYNDNSRLEDYTIHDISYIRTWQLIEALSLLCTVVSAEYAIAPANEIKLFQKFGPIEIFEDGVKGYLWAQQTLCGDMSGFNGRPDLIVTSTAEHPHQSDVLRIIEVKCVQHLNSNIIRSEFGKAYDLRVPTYIIWSFYSPSEKMIKGARGLGLDLLTLGFDTEERADLVQHPEKLISRVINAQDIARSGQNLKKSLESAHAETQTKIMLISETSSFDQPKLTE